MAIRRTADQTIWLDHDRTSALNLCLAALDKGGFRSIVKNETAFSIAAQYRSKTAFGSVLIVLEPDAQRTAVKISTTANMDNLFALFTSPITKIQTAFLSNLETTDT